MYRVKLASWRDECKRVGIKVDPTPVVLKPEETIIRVPKELAIKSENTNILIFSKIKLIFRQKVELKTGTMKSLTLGDFVTAQTSEQQKSRLSLLPVVIYNKFIAKHLTGVDELCVQLATSREPRDLTQNEMKDAAKSDTDKAEDAEWD